MQLYIMLQLYNAATQTEREIGLPKVGTKSTRLGRERRPSGVLNNKVSKSFPDNSDGRDNRMPLWPASRKPDLQGIGSRSFDCRTVSSGQATVYTLKDMFLNVIVIEKNCSTPVMKSPG